MVSINGTELLSEEQEARSKLRESFLRAVNELNGEPCCMITYEKSSLRGTFSGWKIDGSDLLFRDLVTPTSAQLQSALLRATDLISIHFDKPKGLP